MKYFLKFVMIVSFVITLSACGRMGDLMPVTDTANEPKNAISSND